MGLIFKKIKHFLAKMQDILFCDLFYVPPCIVKWVYHRKIKKDIFLFKLKNALSGKKASLYQHGKWESENKEAQVTLILHGLYSHPCFMLHLAKMAQKTNLGPVFSFFVAYDEVDLNKHRILIEQALDRIETLLHDKGYSCKGIVMVGHSMGAIESAYKAFVERDKRILAVISIAGRLKVVDSICSPCRESLKPSLNKIYKGIQSLPEIPLYQIVGGKDWIASLESTLVRRDKGYFHIIEKAMHFNILFDNEMQIKFPEFLIQSFKRHSVPSQ